MSLTSTRRPAHPGMSGADSRCFRLAGPKLPVSSCVLNRNRPARMSGNQRPSRRIVRSGVRIVEKRPNRIRGADTPAASHRRGRQSRQPWPHPRLRFAPTRGAHPSLTLGALTARRRPVCGLVWTLALEGATGASSGPVSGGTAATGRSLRCAPSPPAAPATRGRSRAPGRPAAVAADARGDRDRDPTTTGRRPLTRSPGVRPATRGASRMRPRRPPGRLPDRDRPGPRTSRRPRSRPRGRDARDRAGRARTDIKEVRRRAI